METINFRPNHLLACSLLLAAACDSSQNDPGNIDESVDPAPLADIDANGQQQVPVVAPIVDCPSARMIGVLNGSNGSCSLRGGLPPNWIWTGMFEDGSPGVDGLTLAVPDDLKRFCMFEYDNGKPGPEEYAALFSAIDSYAGMDLDSVASDCRGEFAQGDLNDPALAFELHDAFRSNIDWVDAATLAPAAAGHHLVDVTVVDTISPIGHAMGIEPTNEHGLQMSALIADIACPDADPNCLEQFRYTLAMPREDWASGPDWFRGGQHGTQGDLALAIYEAVGSWHERRLADPVKSAPRLVLNLSLGWQRLTEDANDLTRGPSKSLISALQYASCQGALVFVAAGNNPDEGCPDEHKGPLAPAAFEEMAAPTAPECAALGFSPPWAAAYPVFGGPGDYTPLVHAVAAVDQFDRALMNHRLGGRSRLAALGANGLVADAGGSTEPLTGSSVSAAVASGAAALLWSYRPDLRPFEVVDLLHSSGWELNEPAEFGLIGGGSWDINRISVCAALSMACDGLDPHDCPNVDCKSEAPAADGNMSGFFSEVDAILADPATQVDEIDTGLGGAAPVCEMFDWTELADPQPEKPLCSRCNMVVAPGFLTDDDSVKMTTDSFYDGQVVSASLTVVDATGTPTDYTFSPIVIAAINSPITDVTVAYVNAPNTVSATLNFGLSNGTTQSNSIPVSIP